MNYNAKKRQEDARLQSTAWGAPNAQSAHALWLPHASCGHYGTQHSTAPQMSPQQAQGWAANSPWDVYGQAWGSTTKHHIARPWCSPHLRMHT